MTDPVLNEIIALVIQFNVQKVILFGSRARGDQAPHSDYDIAIFAEQLSSSERSLLSHAIDDIKTLKKIDLVFMPTDKDTDFARQIVEQGVVIYDQAGN